MKKLAGREEGFTIIEVLVAALILVAGAFATFGVLSAATISAQRAKATQVALDLAQQELEALRSLSNKELALTVTPPQSSDQMNPDYRVSGSEFALKRGTPPTSYKKMVVEGGELLGGGFITGAAVSPGPTPFTTGDVKGQIYRYIVWRNDSTCPEATCPGTQDYKQIIVAVKLETRANESAERGYVEVQSDFIDPTDSSLNDPVPGAEGVITAQQFFLSDTPCSASGSTVRREPIEDHPLHNTLGVCQNGLQTGSTAGAPDALLPGAPPDPTPEDPNSPPLFDFSNDYASQPTPETAKGIQLRRDDTGECHYTPTGTSAPQWQVHRWVTDPLPSQFTLTESVTLDVYTRTLSDSTYKGGLCVYLFDRHESAPPATPSDSLLVNKVSGKKYWLESQSTWWKSEWHELRMTMKVSGPVKIPEGDRLGLALSVERTSTAGDALAILYDNPKYRSRIEVDTPTPLSGGG